MTQAWPWHDLHVHTRPHSPDAHWRASLRGMLKKAARNGVHLVGLANHYFPPTDFAVFQRLPGEVARKAPAGMQVLVGAELCVLDRKGRIALTETEAAQLDYVLAGPHHFKQHWVEPPPMGDAAAFVEQQHQMLLSAVRNPLVDGLAHPWVINIQHAARRWQFEPRDFLAAWTERHWLELGELAHQHDTVIEVGMGIHLMAQHQGPLFWRHYARGMQSLKASKVRFYFGSDAHHLHVIARIDWLGPTLERLRFTPDDIIDPLDWVRRRRNRLSP